MKLLRIGCVALLLLPDVSVAQTRITTSDRQTPVHFGCSMHYELRDIQSERLMDSAEIPELCGQIPEPRAVKIPEWVTELNSGRK